LLENRQLVGPRREDHRIAGADVVRSSHTDRQSTLLVRTEAPIEDPEWTVHELTLEDLILAYLAEGTTRANHDAWGVTA